MKKFPTLIIWCLLALVIFACGGGSGSSTTGTTGVTGTTASGAKTAAYDIQAVSGTLVSDTPSSTTPQTVQIRVNGVVRSLSNVIVILGGDQGDRISVLKEGSKIFNVTIANPGLGASVGTTSLRIPVSSSGTVQATVLATSASFSLRTPPATWQGFEMPNGVALSFSCNQFTEGDRRIYANSTVEIPAVAGSRNGTTTYSYNCPRGVSGSVSLFSSDNSYLTIAGPGGPASTNGSVTIPWTVSRMSSDPLIFTTPGVSVDF